MEFLGIYPARGVVLAQQGRSTITIRVGGADPRITRHRAPYLSQPTNPDLPPGLPV